MTSVFSVMNSVTPVHCLRSNRNLSVQPKHKTWCHRFHYRKNILPFVPALLLIQLHSMNLVLYKHHIFIIALCCDSRTKPIHDKFQKPFLEIDVKGGERDHIKAYHLERDHIREYHFHSGRKRSPGGENTQVESISQGSQMLGVQEERCHMSS